MQCILVRYGIAVEPDGGKSPSHGEGEKRVRQAADGLAALDCKPAYFSTSPFVRAYDTARLLCGHLSDSQGRDTGRIGCLSEARAAGWIAPYTPDGCGGGVRLA